MINNGKGIIIAGLGSIGSWLAIAMLESNRQMVYSLIDNDVVEYDNIGRQAYRMRDIGLNKSQAMARIISQEHRIKVNASYHCDDVTKNRVWSDISPHKNNIIIDCCDNMAARSAISHIAKSVNARCFHCGFNLDNDDVVMTMSSDLGLFSQIEEIRPERKKVCADYNMVYSFMGAASIITSVINRQVIEKNIDNMTIFMRFGDRIDIKYII